MRALVLLLAVTACSSLPPDCQTLSDCCDTLAGSAQSSCQDEVGKGAEAMCSTALDAVRQGGACPGPAVVAQPKVCAHYVTCVATATPSVAAETNAEYGSDGTCWQSTKAASTCEADCTSGLTSLLANGGCACQSNDDCTSGLAPTCDPYTGKCVGCVHDTDCPAADHCDLTSLTCHYDG